MRVETHESKRLAVCPETRALRISRAGLTCSRDGVITWGEKRITVSRGLASVLFLLMASKGVVSKEEFADWLYGESLDGGPLTARVRTRINLLRSTLARHGLPVVIKTRHAIGYELRTDLMPPPGTLLIPGRYTGSRESEPFADNLEAFA